MSASDEIENYEEVRARWRTRYVEPMDEDTLELLKDDLFKTLGRANRLCNLLLMRPKGLGEGCIDAIEDIKCNMSRIEWYLKQRDKPVIRQNIDAIRLLVEANIEANGPLGDAARTLLPVLPLGSQT